VGLDRVIDPETGDYVDDGAGGDVDTETIETAAYHQILTHLGEYWAGPEKGSEIHRVPEMSATEALQKAPATLTAALQALVDAGFAKDLKVEVVADERVSGRIVGATSITDVQKGRVDLSKIAGLDS